MLIPKWLLVVLGLYLVGLTVWTFLLATARNPLPFPDPGSRIFSAPTAEAREAVVALLAKHGLGERLRADSAGVGRSILMDGTIINHPSPDALRKVEGATACIGLVADKPQEAAEEAARFLRQRGFAARVAVDIEPDLPIAFVLTDALSGSCINFRPHITRMPRPK
ncbi:hypothetical protein [Brevundimonas lenta]|uniref:Uncharacterized protein n=1 Tax=Brevundimonas lenta TaxID=424796 RepID=A0A7W6NPX7_9CAUL|nr:hypothetical protein [Brevundimonas lenta]MBB4082999.1 hypothetical protein [Brevundimonas lenta]